MFQFKMKVTKIISICLVAVILFAVTPTASAVENQPTATETSHSEQASPRTEETIWVSRVYNGKKQMRLWSITRGKWLTDWLDYDL